MRQNPAPQPTGSPPTPPSPLVPAQQTDRNGKQDYAPPASWNAYSAPGAEHAGKDPVNVVLSANSNVAMPELMSALQSPGVGTWYGVGTGTNLRKGQGVGPEYADIEPKDPNMCRMGKVQDISARQGGLATELFTEPLPAINHFRGYQQNASGAWFLAASKESANLAERYHDVKSFNGGRDGLVSNIVSAAQANGWQLSVRYVQAQPPGNGSNNVPYDGRVAVLTITNNKSPGPVPSPSPGPSPGV